jgi:hypothetical protein
MPVKDPFLAGVLATVPEADRGKAEARLIELEDGGLRQADYSKLSAEAQSAKKQFDDLYAKNMEWFETRKADLGELDTLRAKVAAGDTTHTTTTTTAAATVPADVITKKQFEEHLATMERGAVGFIAESNVLALKHYQQFGEVLNISELLADPNVQRIGLQGVYQAKFAEQIKAKADAAQTARDEALRKEGADKARADLAASRHPYPVVGNEPSSLDALEAAQAGQKPTVKTLDDIAAEYARLGASRGGAPA